MALTAQQIKILCSECSDVELRLSEPLHMHTSFRTGGPAAVMAFPKTEEQLKKLLTCTHLLGVRPLVLGAGTNVLMPDSGLNALVICLKDCLCGVRLTEDDGIEAMAGQTLAKTAVFARDNSLSGLEFAHGIPGTVGGAVYMNAGAYGGEMKQVLVSGKALAMDGSELTLSSDELELGYRTSIFNRMDAIIVSAVFQLQPGQQEQIQQTMLDLMARRRASQPLELPSAGSTFKRPEGYFAGALIEQAGLKGKGVGGAKVSEKHAGFVVNYDHATSDDVLQTIAFVQKTVFEKSGVMLEPEVRIWQEE